MIKKLLPIKNLYFILLFIIIYLKALLRIYTEKNHFLVRYFVHLIIGIE